ncbi:class I SAM-dependent methyltransferase [candidate division KSB1 bacterium]
MVRNRSTRPISRQVSETVFESFSEETFERVLDSFPGLRRRVETVLDGETVRRRTGLPFSNPGSTPFYHQWITTGYYKTMIYRYLIPLSEINNKTVVDVGCGLAWGAYLLGGYCRRLIAADISSARLSVAARAWDFPAATHLLACDGRLLGLADNSVDVVLSMEVLEHLISGEGKNFLQEIHRVLKEDGHLFLSSSFPPTKEAAYDLISDDHPFIWTADLIQSFLGNIFSSVEIHDNWYLIARK